MSEKSDFARLEFILKNITQIELSLERHGGIKEALLDFEGWNAILLCLFQIGETLSKIKNEEWKQLLPSKDAYAFRNIVAHDYDAVKSEYVFDIIDKDIPDLKHDILLLINKKREP
jgi:uncharacterized protein with HEPN domain